jgi:hypothetical protein
MHPKKSPEKAQATGPAAGTRARSRSPEKTANTGHESSLSTRIESQDTLALPRRPSAASIASNAASDAASTQSIPGYFPKSSPECPATDLSLGITPALPKPTDTLANAIGQAPKGSGAAQKRSVNQRSLLLTNQGPAPRSSDHLIHHIGMWQIPTARIN